MRLAVADSPTAIHRQPPGPPVSRAPETSGEAGSLRTATALWYDVGSGTVLGTEPDGAGAVARACPGAPTSHDFGRHSHGPQAVR